MIFVKDNFSLYLNPFTDLVKQHKSFKLELDSWNEGVIVIISYDLKVAPSATVQAGKSEPVNNVKRISN